MLCLFAILASAGPSFDHDHALLGEFLDGAVTSVGVDYGVLATRTDRLTAYLGTVATADISAFDRGQQLAFWVNSYNAYTLLTVLQNQPLKSVMDLDGGKLWQTRRFQVAGDLLTLDQIEHQRVRQLGDGRIHAVVNCAAIGCPPLPPEPLRGADVERQLDEAARRWVATNAYRISGGTAFVSKIFDWYGEDFGTGDKKANAVAFIARYAPPAEAQRLRGLSVDWNPYDWGLNVSRRGQ